MDSMSQCSEDEVLVNEVVDRTPDTSSDLPSSLEKRPYLLSSDEDTGDKMMTTVISMRCQISRFLRRQRKKGVLSGEKYNNLRKTPSSKL